MADSTTNIPQVVASAGADVVVNELMDAASPAMLYGRDASESSGLTWGYLGGRYIGTSIANGTVTLTASLTNYIVADATTGAVSVSTSNTNWNNTAAYHRLHLVVTGVTAPTDWHDFRAPGTWSGGGAVDAADVVYDPSGSGLTATDVQAAIDEVAVLAGSGFAWNAQTGSYTLVLGDANNGVAMNVAGANNLTVPPNSSVAFPVGTPILIYQEGAGLTSIVAGSGVTLRERSPLTLDSAGQYALITLIKRATDTWVLAGDLA